MIYLITPFVVTFIYCSSNFFNAWRGRWTVEFFDDLFCSLTVSTVTSLTLWMIS